MSAPPSPDDSAAAVDDTESNSLVYAALGAVVTVGLSFVPLSPVLGGAVAGYLEDADRDAAIRVGAIAGAIASLPLLLVALLAALFGGFVYGGIRLVAVVLVFLVLVALYTVGLSAVGGALGDYARDEL